MASPIAQSGQGMRDLYVLWFPRRPVTPFSNRIFRKCCVRKLTIPPAKRCHPAAHVRPDMRARTVALMQPSQLQQYRPTTRVPAKATICPLLFRFALFCMLLLRDSRVFTSPPCPRPLPCSGGVPIQCRRDQRALRRLLVRGGVCVQRLHVHRW